MRWRDTSPAPVGAVTPVEVFFDVVFVFTLTQLTRTLEADLTIAGVGRILLLFATLWWMYGGYAWLTNHVPPRRPSQKLLLFAGMAGFFIAAIGIPRAFSDTGVIFGAGYLVVIGVHLLLFTQADALAGVTRLAPFNIGAALLILAAGFQRGAALYVLWVAALVLMAIVPYFVPRLSWVGAARFFHVTPAHFVERHALLLIIALGESVIAIGVGVDTTHLGAGTLGMIVLALLLPAALWWAYFTDVPAAEHALQAADAERRSLLCTKAYFFAHIPILLGIIIAAAGIHSAIAHPAEPAKLAAAGALAGGVALFLLGTAEFRRSLRIASVAARWSGALAVLATIPIGLAVTAGAQLAAVVVVLIALLVIRRREHPPATAYAS